MADTRPLLLFGLWNKFKLVTICCPSLPHKFEIGRNDLPFELL